MRGTLGLLALLAWTASAALAGVSIQDLTLHDSVRDRDIPLKAYVPEGKGPFPVIVFSHGAGGSKDGYGYLGSYWAVHGYVSLHPTHLGSDSSQLKKHRPLHNLLAIKKMVQTEANFEDRPADILYVTRHLDDVETAVPALKGKLDATRLGIAGHSFGAYTTLASAGAKVTLDGKDHDYSVPNAKAFIALSPQGPGKAGFSEGSYAAISRPVLVITGTKDSGLDRSPWTDRKKAYDGMSPGGKALAVFDGGTHMDFARGGSKQSDAIQATVQALSLLWWDAKLKGDAEAEEKLKGFQAMGLGLEFK